MAKISVKLAKQQSDKIGQQKTEVAKDIGQVSTIT